MTASQTSPGVSERQAAAAGAAVEVGERARPATPPSLPARRLDVFPNPAAERDYLIEFQVPEFTCNCPLTGQPDFAQFWIDMIPGDTCIELKSLKLYFWSYRNEGAFHEKVTNSIADDIVAAAKPRWLRISAKWNVRGGIYTNVVVEHRGDGWRPAEGWTAPPVR
ncbi:preQ(1) synthase [Piscinibacter koreensis]|uniref:NADPH-dependent 7-cyano-7-deazaguanine reductase n=1 Tax=Piscinibacter koreensis TaxID=2742824 RepID=A0A7Y6NR29_9BURK|nr:preQ(1) synthase [Schlegelella koreensis]NUZ07780.1 NADPH-dependent 7-cyano-7-deazaguanine reductase QueF [Schlegelella koreensis]